MSENLIFSIYGLKLLYSVFYIIRNFFCLDFFKYFIVLSQIENLLKTAKEKAGVLCSLQGTLREIKQMKKLKRDEVEAEIENISEVFINAIHRVSDVLTVCLTKA